MIFAVLFLSSTTCVSSGAHRKPEAPVAVKLDARHQGGALYDVSLHATPLVNTSRLEVKLVLPSDVTLLSTASRATFGATPSGTERTLTATIRLEGRSAQLAGIAWIALPTGGTRSRSDIVQVGALARPRAAPWAVVTLPTGARVAEVRD